MTIVRCPRCRDEVTAPATAPAKALVRCPLCLEEYPLADALANVPPALYVIGGDEPVGAAPSGGEEYRLAGTGFRGVFDASGPASSAGGAGMLSRPNITAAPRPRKREKNAVVELVKVVLGGVVGLAIGLLIMWWALKQDPLQLGPDVAAYAPWLVPVQFHGKSQDADAEAVARPQKSRVAQQPSTKTHEQPASRAAIEPPSIANEPAVLDVGPISPMSGGLGGRPLAPALDAPLDLPQPAAANLDLPPLDLPAVTAPAAADTPAASDERQAASPPPMPDLRDLLPDSTPPAELAPEGARSAPSPATFARAVAAATAALVTYEGLPKEDAGARQEAFMQLFQAASEVGRIATSVSVRHDDLTSNVSELNELLDTISGAKGSSKLNAVKFLAAQQWPKARAEDGLLVAGTVKAVRPSGRLFEITLDASARSELIIPVLSADDPDSLCAVGDNIVVVGRVFDEPQQQLPGYEGDHARVLLLGHAVRAPKP